MENLIVDVEQMVEFLRGLLNQPSPTGFTDRGVDFTARALEQIPGIHLTRTRKGGLLARVPGRSGDAPRGLTAHVDTLGGMVKEIKPSGRLKITRIGGLVMGGVENEGCVVFTNSGEEIRGSLVLNKASVHVHGAPAIETKREEDSMEVRLDKRTCSAEETRALGVEVGDFIAFDPRVEVNDGFVRSRFLDDKASVACVVGALRALQAAGLQPAQDTYFLVSNYEEVGHGASAGFPPELTELVAVDMAAVGDGQTSDEYHTTLCVKDSGGPYHHGLSQRLRRLAEANGIEYKVDIYPHYGSDGEALWHAGADVAVALIGPGVDGSHSYERTHSDALRDTAAWIAAYLLAE